MSQSWRGPGESILRSRAKAGSFRPGHDPRQGAPRRPGSLPTVSRGEIWLLDLDPIRGHEQAGRRPGLVVSVDFFNHGPAELVIVVPLTTKDKRRPLHVAIDPPEAGLRARGFAKCEDVRSISPERLLRRWGKVSPSTLAAVEQRLRSVMGL